MSKEIQIRRTDVNQYELVQCGVDRSQGKEVRVRMKIPTDIMAFLCTSSDRLAFTETAES